ncbi:MAG: MBL fold metallo-hydrolase [Saprospiraceae bacterium]|nr:MBL fold metallo-hydrolase [Saprospiraceae bacterium]
MDIHCFVVNPFAENTFLVWDKPSDAIIIDPGFYQEDEQTEFLNFIAANKLTVKHILLTHAHIDHIFGLEFLFQHLGIRPRLHPSELLVYQSAAQVSQMYGLKIFNYPSADADIIAGSELTLGNIQWKVLFTPGHSPGSVSYYVKEESVVFSGDVLFEGSIGRTDLPGSNYDTLIHSIQTNLLNLPNETRVYSGHGPVTTIGQEKLTNPFLS